jgi:cytidine deaminase
MKKTDSLTVNFTSYDGIGELEETDRKLAEMAVKVAKDAYAPYSGFRVGAAVLLENGVTVTGVNVENAAYPSGICAERSAVYACHSAWPGIRPVAVAVAAIDTKGELHPAVSPCGNCRQSLAEEEHIHANTVKLILCGKRETRVLQSVADLLPMQFSMKDLNR